MKVKTITPIVAQYMLKKDKKIALIDVRTKEEFEKEKHIKISKQMELKEIEKSIKEKYPDKNQTIILCCKTGVRSREATERLTKIGYKNVYDMGSTEYWIYQMGSE